jgi:glucose-1-phosphate thymidylyltransferase
MKGIILAGGTGSRLFPLTKTISKQLLPVYDKPMIFYPLTTLILAGIKEVLVITTPNDEDSFRNLLNDGRDFGIKISYTCQPQANGLAEALILGESFLDGDSCLLILGDNIFHGVGLGRDLEKNLNTSGCHIFVYEVSDPSQYGVLSLDKNYKPTDVVEKPTNSKSKLAITGIYFFDSRCSDFVRSIQPSERGELEITSLISKYLDKGELTFTELSRGTAWLDTGTFKSLHDAATFVRLIEERQGLKIGDPYEAAKLQGLINL